MKYLYWFFLLVYLPLKGQIPLNSWYPYQNYKSAKGLCQFENSIFCYTENGLFKYNISEKQSSPLLKTDGFYGSKITAIAATDSIVIFGHNDGTIEFYKPDKNLFELNEELKLNPYLIEGKIINDINPQKNYLLITGQFGLVILNISTLEITENVRTVEEQNDFTNIMSSAITDDSIFVKTAANKVYSAKYPSSNSLAFYKNWKISSNQEVFREDDFPLNPLIVDPQDQIQGNFTWVADYKNGLLGNFEGSWKSYSPEGLEENFGDLIVQSDSIFYKGDNTYSFEPMIWVKTKEKVENQIEDSFGRIWKIQDGKLVAWEGNKIVKIFSGFHAFPKCISMDQSNQIWIGTENGIEVLPIKNDLNNLEAYFPIFENQRLFIGQPVNAIAIDPGDRKWFGLKNGLALMDNTEMKFINQENSPLIENEIKNLAFHKESGLLLVKTKSELWAYMTDAKEIPVPQKKLSIYPNPIRKNFEGSISFENQKKGSTLIISNELGEVCYRTNSNGIKASWDLIMPNGQRAEPGIYFIKWVDENNKVQISKFMIASI